MMNNIRPNPVRGRVAPVAVKSAQSVKKRPRRERPVAPPDRAAPTAGPLLALIEEYGSDIIFHLNDDGKLISWSGAARRALGPEIGAAVGRPFTELLRETDHDRWQSFLAKGSPPPLRVVLAPTG